MNTVVTGSIAYDYLMSFPGKFTEHFLPEHFSRVSLSFLVDTMDKRRGGCAPNIAYTLALLGERRELRPFHAHVGAPLVHGRADRPARIVRDLSERSTDRMGKGDVGILQGICGDEQFV